MSRESIDQYTLEAWTHSSFVGGHTALEEVELNEHSHNSTLLTNRYFLQVHALVNYIDHRITLHDITSLN